MKSYSETFTFKQFDRDFHIAQTMKELKAHMKIIPKEVMENQMINIEHIVNIPIKKQVMKDYRENGVVFYIVDDDFIMPSTVPIFITKNAEGASKYNAIVNITPFAKITKDQFGEISEVRIDDRKLFVLLATAWFYRKWFSDETSFYMNTKLMQVAANMYAKLAYKILDKKWSIGIDFKRIDICLFIFAYFFAYYMAGDEKRALDIATTISGLSSVTEGKKVAEQITLNIKSPSSPFKSFEDCIMLLNASLSDIIPIDTMVFIGA